MEKSKVSRAASRLEEKGLITKEINDKDRRLIHLTLTPKGHKLMSELLPLASSFQDKLQIQMAEAFEGFERGLDKILDEIEL